MNNVIYARHLTNFYKYTFQCIGAMKKIREPKYFLSVLIVLCLSMTVLALSLGPVIIPAERIVQILFQGVLTSGEATLQEKVIIFDIRLTRILLALAVGAGLAVTGAVFQGLFRNPLADPGLVGVSSGAAVGAVFIIVLGMSWLPAFMAWAEIFAVAIGAFMGSLLAIITVYFIGTRKGFTSTSTLLLAGVAIAAICQAAFGALTYIADDNQLRSLTFWTLGSLAGTTWRELAIVVPLIVFSTSALLFLSRELDVMLMGDAVAHHLGIPVENVKRIIIVLTALIVGCSVAISGIIAFIGLVIPHLMRMLLGTTHSNVLPASALAGGLLLMVADTISRTVVAPAELPVGLVTSIIGGPFFLWVLVNKRSARIHSC